MPAKLKASVIQEFPLEKTDADHGDPNDPTKIRVRQGTTGDLLLRNDYFSTFESMVDEEGNVVSKQEVAVDRIRRKEVYLTLAYCNYGDETGAPIFQFEDNHVKDEDAFNKAWGKLPPIVSQEIIDLMLKVNPQWTNQGNKSSPTT